MSVAAVAVRVRGGASFPGAYLNVTWPLTRERDRRVPLPDALGPDTTAALSIGDY
jgi:hypothetical protein